MERWKLPLLMHRHNPPFDHPPLLQRLKWLGWRSLNSAFHLTTYLANDVFRSDLSQIPMAGRRFWQC